MKITVHRKKEYRDILKFPVIMKAKNSGTIVLFFEREFGSQISENLLDSPRGYWDIDKFEKFDGEITLRND